MIKNDFTGFFVPLVVSVNKVFYFVTLCYFLEKLVTPLVIKLKPLKQFNLFNFNLWR